MTGKFWKGIAYLGFLLLLAGCARMALPAEPPGRAALRWPPAPLPPRIEWVGEIAALPGRDTGRFWGRLVAALVGTREERLLRPYGVLADRNELLIVDSGAARLHLLEGDRRTTLPQERKTRGGLIQPIAAARDVNGTFYVTDSAGGMVYRFKKGESSLQNFLPHRLGRPTGIAFHPQKNLLYVSDTSAHQIIAFDLGGIEQLRIGARGSAPGMFNFPTDLCVDRKGQLYVTDALNHRIQVFTPEGQLVAFFGETGDSSGYLPKPKGVAVDSDGHIYVVDALLDTVQIFDDSGRLLLDFGMHGNAPGEFWLPSGIDIDENDLIYVSDTYNRRIQMFRYLPETAAETDL